MQLSFVGGRLRALVFAAALISAAVICVLVSGGRGLPTLPSLEAQLGLAMVSSAAF